MYILFCRTNLKIVFQTGMKDWTFEVNLLTGELSSWFQLIESLKMTCARPYAWFWFFLLSGGVLDSFSQPNALPKLSKITVNCPKPFILTSSSILTCPKSAEWLLTIRCSKCAKWPVWKSMYLKSWRSQKHKTWTLGKPQSKGSIKSSA